MTRIALTCLSLYLCFGLISFHLSANPLSNGSGKGVHVEQDFFDLSLDELLQVEVVTASRRKEDIAMAPGIISIISAEKISASGAQTLADVVELSAATLSIGTYMFPNNLISIRGSAPGMYNTHVLVLINGRPFRENQNGGADMAIFNAFPISAIQQVEIIRGAGSVLYGSNAFAGVVNVITVSSDDGGSGSIQVDHNEGVVAHFLASRTSDWALMIAGHFSNSGPVTVRAVDEAGSPFLRNYQNENSGLLLTLSRQPWSIQYVYTHTQQGHVGTLPIAGLYADDATIGSTRSMLDIGYRLVEQDWQQLDLAFTWNHLRADYINPGQRLSYMDGDDQALELVWQFGLDDVDGLLGAQVEHSVGESRSNNVTGDAPGDIVPAYAESNWRLFSEATYRISDALKLQAGIQLNKPEATKVNVSKRLAANYKWSPNWSMKVQYAEAFRAASVLERQIALPGIVIGNPEISPELNETIDLQFQYQTEQVTSKLTMFRSKSTDLINRVSGVLPDSATYLNLSQITYQGAKFELEYMLSSLSRLDMSLSFQENESDRGRHFTGMAATLIKLGYSSQLQRNLKFAGHLLYAGQWRGLDDLDSRNPAAQDYIMADLKLAYEHSPSLSLSAGVSNAFDELVYHPEIVRRNMNTMPQGRPGRRFYLSATYKL